MEKPVVLIVEDEALIRLNAVYIVEEAGFAAVEASNAAEAIGILESRDDIRAVFADIDMSGSNGRLEIGPCDTADGAAPPDLAELVPDVVSR